MAVLLAALAAAVVIGAGVAWITALLAKRSLSGKGVTYLFRMFLVLSAVPYGLFISHTVQFGTRTYGHYPGLAAFVNVALAVAGALVLLSLLLSCYLPLIAALLPAGLFACHRLFVVKQLNTEMPAEPLYDNMPTIALFIITAGATVFLVLFVWLALSSHDARYNNAL